MQKLVIIGTDVSKSTLDHGIYTASTHLKTNNNPKGFQVWLHWALKFGSKEELWVIMEHTGYYSYQFELFLHQHQICYTKVAALEIKRSIGLVRGKSDKIDALAIKSIRLDAKRSATAATGINRCNDRAKRFDKPKRQTGKRQEWIQGTDERTK